MTIEIDNKYKINKTDKRKVKSDYSYLREKVASDGSLMESSDARWIDEGDQNFYELPREEQIYRITNGFPFTEDEAAYILDEIIE